MHSAAHSIAVCHSLALAISGTRTVDEIYETALDALTRGLGVSRAAILVFDTAGVMRFTASVSKSRIDAREAPRPDVRASKAMS